MYHCAVPARVCDEQYLDCMPPAHFTLYGISSPRAVQERAERRRCTSSPPAFGAVDEGARGLAAELKLEAEDDARYTLAEKVTLPCHKRRGAGVPPPDSFITRMVLIVAGSLSPFLISLVPMIELRL